jgi:hypothetical protein
MSTIINNPNDEMASNIANLNNMANVAKNVENGINNMSYLNNGQLSIQQQQQQQQQQLQQLQQQQLQQQQQQQQQQQLPSYPDINNYNQQPLTNIQIPAFTQDPPKPSKTKSKLDLITNNLREPILIAVVYVVLNHPSFLNVLGKYVPHIVPENEPSMFNLVIRGLMLGAIIVILNKTVLKN